MKKFAYGKYLIINVSKAIFMIMSAVWVRARKKGPQLGNKRLSIRVPSFEKEKGKKLPKILKRPFLLQFYERIPEAIVLTCL